MAKLIDMLTITMAFSMLLTACAPAPATTAPAAPVASAAPTSTPQATPVPTDEPLSLAAPAIVYANRQSQLVVASTATGNVFYAFAPIPLGQDYNYAFSPDGRTLAMVTDAQLDLIDLRSWTYRSSKIDLYGWLSAVVYSPDETLLALATGETNSDIRIVDARGGTVLASTKVDFSVRNVKFTTDQKAIMLYGAHVDGDWLSTGAPVAAMFSASKLTPLWSVELKNVRDGAVPKDPHTTDIHQPGAAWYYAPAIAFAPSADILYAIHGDEDQLTTVDFGARKVKTFGIHAQQSWLDRLLAFGAGTAYAKGMDGTNKQAVISPDGKTLFIVSTTEAYVKSTGGNWDTITTHNGLQVIAVADGSILRQQKTEAESVALSPDGRYLFLSGWKNANYEAPWSEVYDLASNARLTHMDSIQLMPTRHLDGSPVLVSTNYFSDSLCQLASVDPNTWKVTSDWKGTCISWLLDP